jgi:hypothetical protein
MKPVRVLASAVSFAVVVALVVGCNPTPTVEGIEPSSGPETGGTEVTITGTNFQKGAEVDFGGTRATPTTPVDAKSLTVTTPAGAAGTVEVRVVNPRDRASRTSLQFTYMDTTAPTVSSTDPAADSTAGAEVTAVNVTFSEDVTAATIDLASTPLPENRRGKAGRVTGEVSVAGATATLTLASALAGGFTYTATVTGTDAAGNTSEPAMVTFTVPSPAPAARR